MQHGYEQSLELGGPEALSPLDVVRIFEELVGRPFTVEYVAEDALRAQLAATTDPKQRSFFALTIAYAQGDLVRPSATLADLAHAFTTVRAHASQALHSMPVA